MFVGMQRIISIESEQTETKPYFSVSTRTFLRFMFSLYCNSSLLNDMFCNEQLEMCSSGLSRHFAEHTHRSHGCWIIYPAPVINYLRKHVIEHHAHHHQVSWSPPDWADVQWCHDVALSVGSALYSGRPGSCIYGILLTQLSRPTCSILSPGGSGGPVFTSWWIWKLIENPGETQMGSGTRHRERRSFYPELDHIARASHHHLGSTLLEIYYVKSHFYSNQMFALNVFSRCTCAPFPKIWRIFLRN